jgi:hypothetical protein
MSQREKSDLEIKQENAKFVRASVFSNMKFPYKVANYDPKTNTFSEFHSFRTFAEAYNYPSGTHVVQTHGTSAQVEQMVRGSSSGSPSSEGTNMARRAMAGALIAGPLGAEIGALTTRRGDETYRLPSRIVTAKPGNAPDYSGARNLGRAFGRLFRKRDSQPAG